MVTALIATLFLLVVGLLGYGYYAFGRDGESTGHAPEGMRVNMRLEVFWTGLAALLLLSVFIYVRSTA